MIASPATPKKPRVRSRFVRAVRALVMALLLLAIAKVAWTIFVADGDEADDRRSRAAYLVARVTAPGFPQERVPGVSGVFEGEWRLVTLSMTAMALANLAQAEPAFRPEAEQTLGSLVTLAGTEDVRAFDQDMWNEDALTTLAGPHGHIGYLGHYTLVLAAHRAVGGDASHDVMRSAIVDSLARRLDASPTAQAETYPGETYTADNAVVVAAIALSDLVARRPDAHRATLDRYARLVRTLREGGSSGPGHTPGGIAFGVDREGHAHGGARGSALGWASFYLPNADATLAREEWRTLRERYVVESSIGVAAVREVPDGESFAGDVDSGPVLFGLSPSGTGFALGGARRQHDELLAHRLRVTAELVGTTIPWGGGRHYALAPLVGDAIMLAMDTARPWDARLVR